MLSYFCSHPRRLLLPFGQTLDFLFATPPKTTLSCPSLEPEATFVDCGTSLGAAAGTKHKTVRAACKCPKSAPLPLASGSGEREKYVQASGYVLISNARPGNTTEDKRNHQISTNKDKRLCATIGSEVIHGLDAYIVAHRD